MILQEVYVNGSQFRLMIAQEIEKSNLELYKHSIDRLYSPILTNMLKTRYSYRLHSTYDISSY